MKGVTNYSGISRYYFRKLLNSIINIGCLTRPSIRVLDFGCGKGELKKLLPSANIIGYDIIPQLSDVDDWRKVNFDILVSNQVFYTFKEEALDRLLCELKSKNKNLEIVIGISRQGILNNIGKYLLFKFDAHSATRLSPKHELRILNKHCNMIKRESVMNLADVYFFSFKS